MSFRRVKFVRDEWYHCYARSIDGRAAFLDTDDYERFLQALYVCNGTKKIRRAALYLPTHARLLSIDRGKPLATLAAYSILPNHFHLLLQEVVMDGISSFMQKLGTSYSMYFNKKRSRFGNVFIKPFRARRLDAKDVIGVLQHIHLAPADLFEDEWREGFVPSMKRLEKNLFSYRYSSLSDYEGVKRAERSIVDNEALMLFARRPPLKETMPAAASYFDDLHDLQLPLRH